MDSETVQSQQKSSINKEVLLATIIGAIIISIPFIAQKLNSKNELKYQEVSNCIKPIEQSLKVTEIRFEQRNSNLQKGIDCLSSLPYVREDNVNYQNVISISREIINTSYQRELTTHLKENLGILSTSLYQNTFLGMLSDLFFFLLFLLTVVVGIWYLNFLADPY